MTATILTSHEGFCGIKASISALREGRPALDAMEVGIQKVEDDHRARTVGFAGAPNILGAMECNASTMNGSNLSVGVVGAIKGCRHPISAARRVMEVLPHVMLVGEGASRFAREMGLESSSLLSEDAESAYQSWIAGNLSADQRKNLETIPLAPFISFKTRSDLAKGTVTFLVRDAEGQIFGGVSTSGWAYKYPGRLGDSPIIGAGMYLYNRYGDAACTHTGEMTIRAGTARSVVLYMKRGATVQEACHEAALDLKELTTGYIGPVIIHAMDRHGEPYVVTTGGDEGDYYCFWREGMDAYGERNPLLVA